MTVELTGLAGQIMHSPTAEKLLQPAEVRPEAMAQQAALAAQNLVEVKRSTVGQAQPAEQGRVAEDESRNKEEGQPQERPKARKAGPGEEDETERPVGGLIDVVV